MKKHFVTFYSPGTIVGETTTKEIAAWNTDAAIKMAGEIRERYNAAPYAFQFSTRERRDDQLDSDETARSKTYYLPHCVLRSFEQVCADPSASRELIDNMRFNDWSHVIQTRRGWSWAQPFDPEKDELIIAATVNDCGTTFAKNAEEFR